ncbi:MAG: queuosine precursor transporter [Spirochaetales bacterium]
MLTRTTKRDIIYALYITFMVLVNTIGSKIISLAGVRVSVGIFFMPVLFVATDIVGEVYGEKEVKTFVNICLAMLVIMVAMTRLCIAIAPNENWPYQNEYSIIFGSSLRMTCASIVSFAVSQKLDVVLFAFIRRLTGEKHLWIRNNVATIICQFIDTVLFEFIAFWHLTPTYTFSFLFTLIIPYWLFKVLFALLDTPICYLGVRWLKG